VPVRAVLTAGGEVTYTTVESEVKNSRQSRVEVGVWRLQTTQERQGRTCRRLTRFQRIQSRWRLLLVTGLILSVGTYLVWQALDNFHEVLPQQLFRSAQLSPAHLRAHAKRNGIRTIINLRGPNPEEAWYGAERLCASEEGIEHIDLPIDSRFPTADEMVALVHALESCPKPALIHCQSGIDRTGITSALACLLLRDDATVTDALDQLSWRFGSLPGRKSLKAKRDFLIGYEGWLRQHNQIHTRANFRSWLEEVLGQKV
jgi:protein tyrosine phosphatase (PTP) superfamily phosphohydrolase (DUF442 family)